jgi:drug/metabolite transporter (DMT)-like permease
MVLGTGLVLVLSVLKGEGSPLDHINFSNGTVLLLFGASLVSVSYLILKGFQSFDLNIGTVVLSSELVFGVILAFLVFAEKPRFVELAGGAIILAAQYLLVRAESSK